MKISTQSPSRPRWQHPEDPPGPARYVLEHLGFRRQEARVLGPPARSMGRPRLMAIHGAGADYTQLNPLLYGLQQRGVGSLAMNLSGHSDAGGGAPAMVNAARRDFMALAGMQSTLFFADAFVAQPG